MSFFLFLNQAEAAFIIQRPLSVGLSNGLVGYWTFDGKDMPNGLVKDSTGLGNNGNTVGDMATSSARVIGKIGQAISLDGVDDYIDISNESNFDFDYSNPFSFSMWVYATPKAGEYSPIFSKSDDVGTKFYQLFIDNIDDADGCGIQAMTFGTQVGPGNGLQSCSGPLTLFSTWVHMTVTYDGGGLNNSIKFYLNGVLRATVAVVDNESGSMLSNNNLQLGGDTHQGTFSKIILDDVRIFNRALSGDEIKRLYKIGGTFTVNKSQTTGSLQNGLVGYWTFDGKDISGTTALDRSGQGNNGTLTNGPTKTPGKIGQGLIFDGVNDYLDLGSPASLNVSTNMSAFVWMKSDDVNDGVNGATFMGQCDGAGAAGLFVWGIGRDPDDGKVGNSWGTGNLTHDVSVASFIPGVWNHVGFVRTGTAGNWTSTIYVNGVRESTVTGITTDPGTQTATSIGRCGAFDGAYMDGSIDDVRIYNRAITSEDVKRLYKIGGTFTINKSQNTGSLQNGLVGYWTFDGKDISGTTAIDRSGKSNNGTLTAGTSKVLGKIGQGLNFDGTNDTVDIANESNFDFDRTSSWSISAWVNLTDDTVNEYIFSKFDNSGDAAYAFRTSVLDDTCNLSNLNVKISGLGVEDIEVCVPSRFEYGQWKHVVATYNGSTLASGVKIYVDGVSKSLLIDKDALTASSILNNNNPEIGAESRFSSSFTKGKIDDVRVYNKVLTADEVKRLYNLGR